MLFFTTKTIKVLNGLLFNHLSAIGTHTTSKQVTLENQTPHLNEVLYDCGF